MDSISLAQLVDHVLFVVEAGRTSGVVIIKPAARMLPLRIF